MCQPAISASERQGLSFPTSFLIFYSYEPIPPPHPFPGPPLHRIRCRQAPKADPSSLAGGYSQVEIDPEVQKVAEFAVKTQAKASEKPLQHIKILKVEQQVVAGLNFRLEIVVADGNKHLKARAVVWKKLDGSLALTSWE